MIGLVLVTHGKLAEEFRHALEHVVGPQKAIETVCIGPEDDMEKRRLGRIGHPTSVLVYGAAALGEVSQQVADESLAQALTAGINHLDTAASYGHAEERMGPTVARVREQVFLATKSTERRAEDAWRELNRSLERLRTDHIDLWQVHAVCDLAELDAVFAPGGAIEAFVRAKEEGIVSWVGITGHTEQAPVVHAEALRRHDFDRQVSIFRSELLPALHRRRRVPGPLRHAVRPRAGAGRGAADHQGDRAPAVDG